MIASVLFFWFLIILRPPRSTRTGTLLPYPTLVRSRASAALRHRDRRFPHLRAPVAAAPQRGRPPRLPRRGRRRHDRHIVIGPRPARPRGQAPPLRRGFARHGGRRNPARARPRPRPRRPYLARPPLRAARPHPPSPARRRRRATRGGEGSRPPPLPGTPPLDAPCP